MSFLKDFVFNFYAISENSFQELSALIEEKKKIKNHILVNLGDTPSKFYIIKSGIIRAYIIDDKGKEHTRTIYTPISTTGNLGALIKNEPSNLIYECLTDCDILECNDHLFNALTLKHHDLSILHYKILEKVYIREEEKILDLSMLDATHRYEKLKKNTPGIDNLINQYHIASYLNITPVQLSRIRKNYRN